MRYIYLYICLLSFISCNVPKRITKTNDSSELIRKFHEANNFNITQEIDSIPVQLKRIWRETGLVGFGKDYNSTDILIKKMPSSQLVLFGENKEGIGFILFYQGGYVITKQCLLFQKQKKKT